MVGRRDDSADIVTDAVTDRAARCGRGCHLPGQKEDIEDGLAFRTSVRSIFAFFSLHPKMQCCSKSFHVRKFPGVKIT